LEIEIVSETMEFLFPPLACAFDALRSVSSAIEICLEKYYLEKARHGLISTSNLKLIEECSC